MLTDGDLNDHPECLEECKGIRTEATEGIEAPLFFAIAMGSDTNSTQLTSLV